LRFAPIALAVFAFVSAPTSAQPVDTPPELTKSFSPTTISPGEPTVLTFFLSNATGNSAKSNVSFTDTFPAGLVIANPPNVGGTCDNAAAATLANGGGSSIVVTNLDVPAGPSLCTMTVDVTNSSAQFNAACNGFPTAFTNTAQKVTVSNVTNSIEPACLVVTPPPSVPPVPTLSVSMLVLLGASLAAAAIYALRR
jgi:uncharacterized repeat protein (TIGR01451 family)